jgi:hypothetical protein
MLKGCNGIKTFCVRLWLCIAVALHRSSSFLKVTQISAKTYGGPGWLGFNAASYLDETSRLVSIENARHTVLATDQIRL